MFNKIVSVLTLAAFIVFSMACFHKVTYLGDDVGSPSGPKVRIMSVQLKSNRVVDFPKDSLASVLGDAVVGKTQNKIEIPMADIIDEKNDGQGRIVEVGTKDGIRYAMREAISAKDGIICPAYSTVSIPLTEIRLAWVKRLNIFKTILASSLAVLTAAAVIAALSHQPSQPSPPPPTYDLESCPFIYSYDGSQYVLDGEPYGAAICQGLKRTEWASMDNLKDIDGRYKILLANELNEIQYTDELKLIAVDHPENIKVVPDTTGHIHTFARPLPPRKAIDQKGRDILPLVSQEDRAFWVSPVEEKDPTRNADLRDDLVFEFPKPAGTKQAKLLVNAWTTAWGSRVAKRFLEVRGHSLPDWYADVNRHGASYAQVMRWHVTEELYMLKVLVETHKGWNPKALISAGGPCISKDKAYVLDVGDVDGETLKIKLRPPVNFWMLNYLAVDYSPDLPVQVAELSATSAVDQNGQDVRAKLAALDNDFMAAPNMGDRTELAFSAPPSQKGLKRTILIKASGYYDIHLDASGEPQREVMDKIIAEPGFAARFALLEYLKWEAGLLAGKR